ncbi:MAG: DUF5060 domain-containing protein [Chloroflexi bacterium]|nr:DUF5060 domain-containing protein [Ardenticatenaceae bacterium]NOG37344.1 DUF5060 domain-containing protein [Chloroflexota bacterium]
MLNSYRRVVYFLVVTAVLLAACGEGAETATAVPPTATITTPPTVAGNLPAITAVTLDRLTLPRYESLEMVVEVTAVYTNPYDAREVSLDGLFTAPDGSEMRVPGFWDGQEAWRLRFTPSQEGEWRYQLHLTDANGLSQPSEGTFTVTPSDHHGWLQAGNWVNPAYSGHYLVHHDGTPFYGLGHADALNILIDGFTVERGVGLFNNMVEAGENYVVWWPFYTSSPVSGSYDNYNVSNLNLIDAVVKDAQAKGVFLIFTIWDHPQLRDNTHAWGIGNWGGNGFSKLTDIDAFFTDPEAWVWQENLYRYVIARWGYSPAIGLWQTVSEINGTNAYNHTDPWHEKVNAYFVANDPYRHPTTASRSGDVDWEAGHLAMDAPQVHLYDFDNDAVGAAQVLAEWTSLMFNRAEKPNWVGEFGVTGNTYYPELFHNAIWAALATGAAMTPAEWNSGGGWMRMSPEMLAGLARLGTFVSDLPLAQLKPTAVTLSSSDPDVRGWGIIGADGGLFWVQDFSLEGAPIEQVRADETVRQGVSVSMAGMAAGVYEIRPYHTWQGAYLDAYTVECAVNEPCVIPLPDFEDDMAFQVLGK